MATHGVRVRLYATARAAAGRSFLDVPVPSEGLPVRELVARLAAVCPRLAPVLRASRFLRNDVYLPNLDARVRPGDEFAVHPPYGGG